MKYFVANWKANKQKHHVEQWLHEFLSTYQATQDRMVIICPPTLWVPLVAEAVSGKDGLAVGVQDVSRFGIGSYTGELPAALMTEVVSYSIIGHSERRRYFHETDGDVAAKLDQALDAGLKTILCVDNPNQMQEKATMVAYEPLDAIGTGNNEPLKEVLAMREQLQLTAHQAFLYGGSVNAQNCKDYITQPLIDGLLVGTASLDPHEFQAIVTAL